MKKRFKINRICSSENYILSRRVHLAVLVKNHNDNIEFFNSIEEPIGEVLYVNLNRECWDDDFITFLLNL